MDDICFKDFSLGILFGLLVIVILLFIYILFDYFKSLSENEKVNKEQKFYEDNLLLKEQIIHNVNYYVMSIDDKLNDILNYVAVIESKVKGLEKNEKRTKRKN